MEKKNETNDGRMGRLPGLAPLANPYVPFQIENPPKYEARKGLVRGTLFPGLDLPFMGMVNQKEQPVTPRTEMQALGFAVNELALYLDTHPEDAEALALYRQYQKLQHDVDAAYSMENGPMTHMSPVDHKRYTWIDDPWPWDFAANKED